MPSIVTISEINTVPDINQIRLTGTVLTVNRKQYADNTIYTNIVLADYSGSMIYLRCWEKNNEILRDAILGEMLDVIGRIRLYQGNNYIHVDGAKTVDIDFEILRRLQRINPNKQPIPRFNLLSRLIIKFRSVFSYFLNPVTIIN